MNLKPAALAAVVVVLVLAGASPSSGHAVDGAQPTNYRTDVTSVTPRAAGFQIRVLEFGGRLELTNTSAREIVVLGYEDEPFLRIDARGLFENRRSPSTYLSADRDGRTPVPEAASSEAEPVWVQVNTSQTARWHDHRAHWMGAEPPSAVTAAPAREHVILPRWTVPVLVNGSRAEIAGRLRWIPSGTSWPWIVIAVAAGAGVVATAFAGRLTPRRLGVATIVVVAVSFIECVGVAFAPAGTGSPIVRLFGAAFYLVPGWVAAVVAARFLLRGRAEAALGVIACAFYVAMFGGVDDLDALSNSQLQSALPVNVSRLLVALALGLGFGVTVAAAHATVALARAGADVEAAPA